MFPHRPMRTCTASAAPAAPAARASRSRWPKRASTGCCATSNSTPNGRSRSNRFRPCPTPTRAAGEEGRVAVGLEPYRRVVESLAEEHDVLDLAAAAVKLADAARDGAGDEEEIPAIAAPPPRRPSPRR